jgi:hypothetical protein
MSTPMNRGAYPYQFDKEIAKMVYGKYADYPKEFDKIAKIATFPAGKTYTEAEISGLGSLRAMGEGEAISYDMPTEGHKKSIQTVKFGLGFQKTEEMTADELFAMSTKMSASLSKAAVQCAEQNFFNLFNSGWAAATTPVTAWDAVSVFSLTGVGHYTLKSNTKITNGVASDLSQTALEAAFEYFDGLVDEAGMPLIAKPTTLLIPMGLKWVANDLSKSTGRVWDYSNRGMGYVTGTTIASAANNLQNGVNPSSGIVDSWKIHASRYLTDTNGWYLLSDQADARFYWKKKPTMSSSSDFDTDNEMYKLVMRFAVGVFDYKGMYGSAGSS